MSKWAPGGYASATKIEDAEVKWVIQRFTNFSVASSVLGHILISRDALFQPSWKVLVQRGLSSRAGQSRNLLLGAIQVLTGHRKQDAARTLLLAAS